MLDVFLLNAILVIGMAILLWLISLTIRDASIADIFWGLGFVLLAWNTFFLGEGYAVRKVLLLTSTTLWGVRLAGHIFMRNRGKGEDYRYREMRHRHGGKFWLISFFEVFLLQAFLMFIISLPVQIGQISVQPPGITVFDIIGLIVWITGFIFESVGDFQLARFLSNPAHGGMVMNRGLWAYSRHPNYFGEACMWWGLFIMVTPVPFGMVALVSPLTITFLLLRVSGVTMLERDLRKTNPKYDEYIRTTSAFIPWFPKRGKQ